MKTVPVLRIFDREKAEAFYVDFLGFQWEWTLDTDGGDPIYAKIKLDRCEIHLSGHHGDACPGSTVYLRVAGIDQYCEELQTKHYAFFKPRVELAPWNAKLMEVTDPFGNRLRFCEEL